MPESWWEENYFTAATAASDVTGQEADQDEEDFLDD